MSPTTESAGLRRRVRATGAQPLLAGAGRTIVCAQTLASSGSLENQKPGYKGLHLLLPSLLQRSFHRGDEDLVFEDMTRPLPWRISFMIGMTLPPGPLFFSRHPPGLLVRLRCHLG
jgi:hypothetical protein